MIFRGYPRKDGSVGTRNYVAVISTCACSSAVAQQIASGLEGAVAITHGYGCGTGLEDARLNFAVLNGIAMNPNVAGALIVGLGCEVVSARVLVGTMENSGKQVESLLIQDGGSRETVEKGRSIVGDMCSEISRQKREEVPLSSLVVGLECGGSDAFSGVTANPAVGLVSDWLVEQGATVILSETTEMIGAEQLMVKRAASEEVAGRLMEIIGRMEQKTHESLGPLAGRVIAPGNMDGGMSTILEKSIGCVAKGGSTPVNEVVDYAQRPSSKGLVVMDTPGYDIDSMAGMAAGGAQLMLFTTGRGTPVGFPLIPVIKISSNSRTFEKMKGDMDINAGVVVDRGFSLETIRDQITALILEVIDGCQTRAEINNQAVFGFLKVGTSF